MSKQLQLHSLTDLGIIFHFRYLAPLLMSEFAWSRKETVLHGSVMSTIAGVITILSYLASVLFSKR